MSPADCLAIEDAPNGVRSARAAGMRVIVVATSFAERALGEADLVLDSLSPLVDHLDDARHVVQFEP